MNPSGEKARYLGTRRGGIKGKARMHRYGASIAFEYSSTSILQRLTLACFSAIMCTTAGYRFILTILHLFYRWW